MGLPLPPAETDHVAVRIDDVEILGAPFGRRERLENRDPPGHALVEEGLDAVDAGGGVEVFAVAAVAAVVGYCSSRQIVLTLRPR